MHDADSDMIFEIDPRDNDRRLMFEVRFNSRRTLEKLVASAKLISSNETSDIYKLISDYSPMRPCKEEMSECKLVALVSHSCLFA
jgi:hypothetical protein